jgi:hypothetical protein
MMPSVKCPLVQLSTSTTCLIIVPCHVNVTCCMDCTKLPRHSYGCAMCHHCKGDTCHYLIGPLYLSTSSIHTPSQPATSVVRTLPCHSQLFLPHQLYGYTSCTVSYHMALYRLYELYNQHFLPVWKNEYIAISGAYNVCLSPFKFRWVRIDEAYTHVRFEDITIILIFRPF